MFNSNRNLTVNQWILVFILLFIPVVNLVFLLVWALSKEEHPSIKNFSRAVIKLNLILFGILIAILIGTGGHLSLFDDQALVSGGINPLLPSGTSAVESKIEFRNIVHRTQMGITTISGETTNMDNEDHSYSLTVTFYDKDKKIVGTGLGIVDNIGPGQTKTFEAISQDNLKAAASVKVDVDSMLY
ncbi:FxLYD domain-containing protein [Rossellomorea aquimaris]|uniref:FxLYD domain-containing protein n=1 Tax=Rossellomorea aquimaris TaxID=189382 RepID=UPI001CFDA67F|nr:FxLYD domain-containing protein [Rossellomorea aquimaris]